MVTLALAAALAQTPVDQLNAPRPLTWGDLDQTLREDLRADAGSGVLGRIAYPYAYAADWPRAAISAGLASGFGGGAAGYVRFRRGWPELTIYTGRAPAEVDGPAKLAGKIRIGGLWPLPGIGKRTYGIRGWHAAPAIALGVHAENGYGGAYLAPAAALHLPYVSISSRLNVDVFNGDQAAVLLRPELGLDLDGLWHLFNPRLLKTGTMSGHTSVYRARSESTSCENDGGGRVCTTTVTWTEKKLKFSDTQMFARTTPNFFGPAVYTGLSLPAVEPEIGVGAMARVHGLGADLIVRRSVVTPAVGNGQDVRESFTGPYTGKISVLELEGLGSFNLGRAIAEIITRDGGYQRGWSEGLDYGRLMFYIGWGVHVPLSEPSFDDPQAAATAADALFGPGDERTAKNDPTQVGIGAGAEVGFGYELGNVGFRWIYGVGRTTGTRFSLQLVYTLPILESRRMRRTIANGIVLPDDTSTP